MIDVNAIGFAGLAGGLSSIPLDCLKLSELNVRKTERDADIEALAEDIAAKGLKQNLVVVPTAEGESLYEVIAGGRRFQALQLLVGREVLPPNWPAPCLIEARTEAEETSLSENLHRVAMNPADEFEAFAAIVAKSADTEDAVGACAKRFGVTRAHVEGRLRLAALAPEILEALRGGAIGIESAKAYAGVSDQELQLKVFKEREKQGWGEKHAPRDVKYALRGKSLSLKDGRLIYVGLDAYRAAGGRIEAEMFMGADGEERALDVRIVEKLAREKGEAAVNAIAKRAGFKEGLFANGVGYSARAPKPPAGFVQAYDYGGLPAKKELKTSIGIYAVAQDGAGLTRIGRFKPAGDEPVQRGYQPPSPEEIARQRREEGVARIAAQLAVGPFAGSPLEGRAYWPSKRWLDPIEQISDDEILVAVQVKVSVADVDAQKEAAAAKYDQLLAEAEAEQARKTAEAAQAAADAGDVVGAVAALDDEDIEDDEQEELAA